MNPYTHPFNVFTTAPESFQVLVGVTLGVMGVVGILMIGAECIVKWWNKRNK
jgi:hypothetical protein